jgi:hypothetical protein
MSSDQGPHEVGMRASAIAARRRQFTMQIMHGRLEVAA